MKPSTARLLLRASGLPSLGPPAVDSAAPSALESAADRLLAGDGAALVDLPVPRVEFLRWLAERRGVLFHGSARDDLEVLEPIRLTRDSTEFGDQQAVFASSDPVWAIYFAVLRRGTGFFSTRNGSMGLVGRGLYPRWYFFSVNRGRGPDLFGSGSLYVLPGATFAPQPPLGGAVDAAHWVSKSAVRPHVRIDVTAADFPLAGLVITHREREPIPMTVVRAGMRARFSGR